MSEQTIHINGMTCQGCVKHVKETLESVPGLKNVAVSLETASASFQSSSAISEDELQKTLGDKYIIGQAAKASELPQVPTKWRQLRPLFVVFAIIISGVILLNFQDWSFKEAMLDFMGLFFLVFGFLKLIDLKGFPSSFAMYDPIAKRLPVYGWLYPFIELGLAVLFLQRIALVVALVITLVLLAATTIGVVRSLLNKSEIRCACLGTWLKLPMTEATLIENSLMIIMAVVMLTQIGLT